MEILHRLLGALFDFIINKILGRILGGIGLFFKWIFMFLGNR